MNVDWSKVADWAWFYGSIAILVGMILWALGVIR